MKNTIALILGILAFISGIAFADDADKENSLPDKSVINDNKPAEDSNVRLNNTLTLDLGPTSFFLLISGILSMDNDTPPSIFGIGAQYERQITDDTSAAIRFEYGMFDNSVKERKWLMSSFLTEGHIRYYFSKSIFFADLTLGYAYILFDNSIPEENKISNAHYFKAGGKFGWRIDFNKPGGFVLEPAIGIYGAWGSLLKTDMFDDFWFFGDLLKNLPGAFAETLFLSGVRFSLGFGYRF